MNRRLATLLLCLCLGIAAWQWQLWQGEQGASPAAPSADVVTAEIEWVSEAPASIENVGEEVFKRAFWRRPSAEDRILQAERHEWHDAEGVSRWQWFLIVYRRCVCAHADSELGLRQARLLPSFE